MVFYSPAGVSLGSVALASAKTPQRTGCVARGGCLEGITIVTNWTPRASWLTSLLVQGILAMQF